MIDWYNRRNQNRYETNGQQNGTEYLVIVKVYWLQRTLNRWDLTNFIWIRNIRIPFMNIIIRNTVMTFQFRWYISEYKKIRMRNIKMEHVSNLTCHNASHISCDYLPISIDFWKSHMSLVTCPSAQFKHNYLQFNTLINKKYFTI